MKTVLNNDPLENRSVLTETCITPSRHLLHSELNCVDNAVLRIQEVPCRNVGGLCQLSSDEY